MSWRRALTTLSMAAALSTILHGQLADDQSRREAVQSYRIGEELLASEKFEQAAEQFQKAIQKDRLLAEAHYELGQAYMGLRRYPNAIKAYEGAILASRALYDLQQQDRFAAEKERTDQIREMEDVIRRLNAPGAGPSALLKALEYDARVNDLKRQTTSIGAAFQPPAETLFALGSALFRNGQRDEAETAWKAALEANPKMGKAHNNLAVVYMQIGRFDQAEEEITLAEKNGMQVNPQFKEDLKKLKEQARSR